MARKNKIQAVVETKYKKKGIEEAKKGFEGLKENTKKNKKATDDLTKSTDTLTKSQQALKKAINSIGKGFSQDLKKVKKIIDSIVNDIKKIGNTLINIPTNLPNNPINSPKGNGKSNPFKSYLGSLKNFETVIKGFLALKVTQYFIDFSKAILQASSNMEELKNITDQVFEDMADDVQKFSEKTGALIGRSIYDLKKYTSEMGAIFKGMGGFEVPQIKEMSQQLAQLAIDIASFKNVSDDEAFNAIRGGIVGETESLKRLGIILNDTTMMEYARAKGIKVAWQNLDASTKAQLRYEKLLESTKFMQGDAARTINSYANQVKLLGANFNNLAVVMGENFKESTKGFLQTFNSLLKSIYNFSTQKNSADFAINYSKEISEVKRLGYEYKALSEKVEQSSEDRARLTGIIEQLKQLYPQETSNLNSLKSSYDDVSKAIDRVSQSLKEKMRLSIQDYYQSKLQSAQQDMLAKNDKIQEKIIKSKEKFYKRYKINLDEFYNGKNIDIDKFVKTAPKNIKGLAPEIMPQLQELNGYFDSLEKLQQKTIKKAQKITEVGSATLESSQDLIKSFDDFAGVMEKSFVDLDLKLKNTAKKQDIEQAKSHGVLVTTIKNNAKNTTDTVIGNNIGLTASQTLEILAGMGTITQTLNGVTKTFKQLKNGSIEELTSEAQFIEKDGKKIFAGNKHSKKILSQDDFKNQLKNNFDVPIIPKILEDLEKPKEKTEKVLTKWEQLIKNLEELDRGLSTIASPKETSKILQLSSSIRKKQIDNIKELEKIGAITLSESLNQQIKALEDELTNAKELKNKSLIENIKQKINNLNINNIIATEIDKINGELLNFINTNKSQTLKISVGQKNEVIKNIKEFQESSKILEDNLKSKLITEQDYINKKIDNTNILIKAYSTIKDLDGVLFQKLTQFELKLSQIKLSFEENKLLNGLDDILLNSSKSDSQARFKQSLENYYNALKNNLDTLVKELASSHGWGLEDFKKVYSSNNQQLAEMVNVAKIDGDKAKEQIASLMLEIKKVGEQKNQKNFFEKFSQQSSELIQGLNNLNGAFDGALDGVLKFANNLNSLVDNISKLDFSKGLNFNGITGILSSIINIGTSIFRDIFIKNDSKKIADRAYNKDVEAFNKDLPKSIDSLRNSVDSLSNDMRNFVNSLIKNVAGNTSNANLLKNQKIANEIALLYANSFDGTVKTTISRTKENYKWWGLSKDTQYLGTETKEESLRKILNLPQFKNSTEILEFYEKNKNKKYKADFENLGSNSGFLGFSGYSHNEKVVGTNFNEVINMLPIFAENVKKITQYAGQTTKLGIYESLDGVTVTSSQDIKNQLREILKKLVESSGQNYSTVANQIESKLNELVKDDEILVNAFDEVRTAITNNLSQGNQSLDSLAQGLQGYFNKIRSNFAKIMYDLEFRDKNNFEQQFIDKFKKISDELVKIRLENKKTVKELASGELDFSDIFKSLKDMKKASNHARELVEEIRKQAKQQGLSDDIIDKMLPLDKVSDKMKSVSSMLQKAMNLALDTSSFDQFSMSIGDSLYNSVKDGLVNAFIESEKFKNLYANYIDEASFNNKIAQANDLKGAYTIIQNTLHDFENRLKSEGLGFRETNASNGEYLGGSFSNGARHEAGFNVSKGNINININTEINNHGFLSSQEVVNGIATQVKSKIEESLKREV